MSKKEKEQIAYLKEFYTLEQLGKEINFNIQTLRIYVKSGKLKAKKIGQRYVLTRDDIKAFLKNYKG